MRLSTHLMRLQAILVSTVLAAFLAACDFQLSSPPGTPSPLPPSPLPSATAVAVIPSLTPAPTVTSQPAEPQATSALPTAEPTPEPKEPYRGIWLTREELNALPAFGVAWENLRAAAEHNPGDPDLSDQDQENNVYVLAKALVYARTGEKRYQDEVVENLMRVIDTEDGGRTLASARNLVAYVIAADLINLPEANPESDQRFREWLHQMLTVSLDGQTIRSTQELRPNNWGTHAGASRVAIALYLGDEAELARAAVVFKGWLGDRDAYAGFVYGRLSWQADEDNPVGINPVGATKEGHSIDGAQPEEMRRGGKFRWPPKKTNYPWGALQGALVQAELLHRAGYNVWEWEDRALLRAVNFLYDIDWLPEGDDVWQPWLINYAYNTTFPAVTPSRPGKNMGWTDWTHSSYRPPPARTDLIDDPTTVGGTEPIDETGGSTGRSHGPLSTLLTSLSIRLRNRTDQIRLSLKRLLQ